MTIRGLWDRATHSPFGLVLLLGAIASLVQALVTGLPEWANVILYFGGIVGLAIGGGGIGLGHGRSDAAGLEAEADLSRARMAYPFWRMIASYRALTATFQKIDKSHDELSKLPVVNRRIEWARVDLALSVAKEDIAGQLGDVDRAIEEWRALVPEEVAKLEDDLRTPTTAEIDKP